MPHDNVKKVLFIITKSNYGGAQKYTFELATDAQNRGYEVAVARGGTGTAGAAHGHLADRLTETGIRVIPVRNFMRDISPLRDWRAGWEIFKIIKQERPHILHVTSSKAGGIGALCGRLAGTKRIIFTSHGLPTDETWRPLWQRVLIYIATWLTLRLSHVSIMISSETYERVRRMPGVKRRVRLIYNGIRPINFLDRQEARTRLAPDIPPDSTWIGGIGELHPNKNWSSLIEAMSRLDEQVHLIIIGDGEERETLQELIHREHLTKRVHLANIPSGAAAYLRAFDVFVLPSHKEGLPYVLLEAGLAGLPVIASDIPGHHDIIHSGQSGLLVNPQPEHLSTAIQTLLKDQTLSENLGHALHEHISNTFSLSEMLEKTFSLYSTD